MRRRSLLKRALAAGFAWVVLLASAGGAAAHHPSSRHRPCEAVHAMRCGWKHAHASRRERAAAREAARIRQLPPHLRSATPMPPEERCSGPRCRERRAPLDLPDILLLPPGPATIGALDRYRIPAIEDVPPVSTLDRGGRPR